MSVIFVPQMAPGVSGGRGVMSAAIITRPEAGPVTVHPQQTEGPLAQLL